MAQDGRPDLSYGNNGVVISDIGTEGDKYINGVGSSANDRIIILGKKYDNGINNFIIAYLEDGSIDTSFGINGFLWTDGSNEDYKGLNVLPDEKILVKSYVASNYTIKRLLPSGTLDVSFGINGQIQPFDTGIVGNEMILDPENNLLVIGIDSSGNEPSIIIKKFDVNGILDVSFGDSGTISYSFGNVSDLSTRSFILKNDKIFVRISYLENNLRSSNIFKLLSNGSIDTTFGTNGVASIPMEEEYSTSFLIFDDGSFLVSGSYYDSTTFETIRKTIKLFPDATQNVSFGINGSIIGFEGEQIQENQRVILNSSYSDFEGGISLSYSRFFPNGTIDNSFQFNSNYSELGSTNFLTLSSGKFLIVGSDIWYNGPQINIILQRFNNTPLATPKFENQKTTIYPNPSNGIFKIGREFSEIAPYQITDVTGKIIASGELSEKQSQVDISSAQSEIYFLKTLNGVFRLLKN